MTQRQMFALTFTLWITVTLGFCDRQESHSSPPRSAPAESLPGDQTASIWADPGSIPAGGAAALTWRTTNATEVSIEGIGAVQTNGSLRVSPLVSTIYHLTAKGAGGTMDATTAAAVRELSQLASSSGDNHLSDKRLKTVWTSSAARNAAAGLVLDRSFQH
jgi:peptidoglycan-associated lipoprotein